MEDNSVKIEYTVNGHTVLMYCTIEDFRDMLAYGVPDGRFRKEIDQFNRVLRESPKEVWTEENEVLRRGDRVTLKDKDGYMYQVLDTMGNQLKILRITNDPNEWSETVVKRNEVVAFKPYKHS